MPATTAETNDQHDRILATIDRTLGAGVVSHSTFQGQLRLFVPPKRILEVLGALKLEAGFGLLAEIGGVDYLGYPGRTRPRYEVVYVLVNLDTSERVVVRAALEDAPEPEIASSTSLWPGANWMEREVFDMYGVRFKGHPDLRRILMPDEFAAYPLRKDYPLRGRGERHNFPRLSREES